MDAIVGIYIRVSTATQARDGYSLNAQKERLTSFCKAQGWEHYKFYVEEGSSGRNIRRPVYQQLINDVKNKKINVVLVYKLDRIMRSIGELDKMLKIFEKYDCGFKSATEPFDTTNPTGKLFMYIVAAFAQWESDVSSERIKMVLEERVANEGVWIGNVPFPFDKDEKTERLVPNERRSKETLNMIDMLLNGKSLLKISKYMNVNNSERTWRANTVLRILRNPALCGDTRWNDDVYKNTHKGIISREKFNKLQKVLDDRGVTRLREVKSTYIFQNKIVCPGCGKTMNVNRFFRERADGSVYQGAVYKCPPCARANNFNKTPSEHALLNALYDYFQTVKLDQISDLKIEDEEPKEIQQLKTLERKRLRYQKAWASDLMTDEEFQKLMEETREPYEKLKEKVENIKVPQPIDIEEIKNVIFMFNESFKSLTTEEKRHFVSRFIRKIKFRIIEQDPVRPDKSNRGRYKVDVTDVIFY